MKLVKASLWILTAFVPDACSNPQNSQPTPPQNTPDYVVLAGKMIPANPGTLTISASDGFLKNIIIASDGSFNDTIFYPKSGYYKLDQSNVPLQVYLEPGYNLNLSFEADDFIRTMQYEGKGAVENNLLAKSEAARENVVGDWEGLLSKEEPEFLRLVDSLRQIQEKLLDATEQLDKKFVEKERNRILYLRSELLNSYQNMHARITQKENFSLSDSFPKPFAGVDFERKNETNFLFSEAYQDLIYNHYLTKVRQKEETQWELIERLKKLKNIEIQNFMYSRLSMFGVSAMSSKADTLYEVLMAASKDQGFKNRLSKKYETVQTLLPGQPSPSFSYEDVNGSIVSLDDFKGQIIYIDLWATWCAPCIAQMPFLQTLEEEYADKNVAFVSISLDAPKDREKWKKWSRKKVLVVHN